MLGFTDLYKDKLQLLEENYRNILTINIHKADIFFKLQLVPKILDV